MFVIVSDIHGDIRLDWLRGEINKLPLTSRDYLIIAGDAGIVWDHHLTSCLLDFYNSLPCTTLFVDGNHENFNILDNMPIKLWNRGRVHVVSNRVYHLMSGEVFNIDNKTFLYLVVGFLQKN